jgi:hypothetical protein
MTSTLASRPVKTADRTKPSTARRRDPAPADLPALAAPPDRELLEGPTRDDLIRRRAFDLYERNGCVDGHADDDWLAAEAEIGQTVLDGAAPVGAGTLR